jgi:hypothetical protein
MALTSKTQDDGKKYERAVQKLFQFIMLIAETFSPSPARSSYALSSSSFIIYFL